MKNCEIHRELLGLPPYVFPAAMLVFGYPTQQQLRRKKTARAALEHVVHENSYRPMGEEELQQMFRPEAQGEDYTAWMQAFCARKYNSAFSREMSRSAEAFLQPFLSEE